MVYRTHDARLGRDVAIKMLPEDVAADAELARFQREARVLASLNLSRSPAKTRSIADWPDSLPIYERLGDHGCVVRTCLGGAESVTASLASG